MKQHSETVSDTIFTHFPTALGRPRRSLLLPFLKKQVAACKNQLQSAATILATGIILLGAVYLFLCQLAEHGWQ